MSLTKKVAHESDYVSTIVHCCFVLLIVFFSEFEVFYSFVTFWMCIYCLFILNNGGVLDKIIC